jgi:hypothetical protein
MLQLRQVNRDDASNVSPDVLCNTVVAMGNKGVVVRIKLPYKSPWIVRCLPQTKRIELII